MARYEMIHDPVMENLCYKIYESDSVTLCTVIHENVEKACFRCCSRTGFLDPETDLRSIFKHKWTETSIIARET